MSRNTSRSSAASIAASHHPQQETACELVLISITGPEAIEQRLDAGISGGTVKIGRRPSHALVLDRPEVSRDHAEFRYIDSAHSPHWVLVDLGSRHRTRLNGQSLRPNEPCPLQAGDIIEISPWTLRLVERDSHGKTIVGSRSGAMRSERQVHTVEDQFAGASSAMRTIVSGSHDLARERLHLLLTCAEAIVSAADEESLAKAVIEAATRGTGFPNAALLRPLMPDGTVSIIADTGAIHANVDPDHPDAGPRLSRSLIQQASQGQPVAISSGDMVVPTGHSIIDLKIQDAMCVPLMLEGAAAGYLYLDTRSDYKVALKRSRITKDAGAFAAGLARLAAMALMNLMRRDLEKRFGRMEGEIAAAASAQRLVLPPGEVAIGRVTVHGECRPGRVVSGDFFDVMPLTDGRIAIVLGDVAGKGMQASVLMTTTQGFLRGVLMHSGNLQHAVSNLNAYLHPRCDGGRFISLWLGAIDPQLGTLEFVNAGHGHAWMQRRSGASDECVFEQLDSAGGPLVGVIDVLEYRSAIVPMNAGDRIVLLSDGILEQPRSDDREDQFGFDRVGEILKCGAASPPASIAKLFDAVHIHAQGPSLADDATVVLAGW